MMGSYRVMFLMCAVFVATALVSGLGVSTYGAAKPPKQVLDRVEETRRSFGGEAHVSPIRGEFAKLLYCMDSSISSDSVLPIEIHPVRILSY